MHLSQTVLRASFSLTVGTEKLRELIEAKGGSLAEWEANAVEWLREDLERELPASDYEPFERSVFVITLESRPATCGRLLVGQGDDTYDPECGLLAGHEETCRPEDEQR